ncbi:chromate efflux transporter [Mechercharimyces sp. CAU 1602]|uniref:chromate efflux transporter n=1 Tax=Mechercharimyces sp. CAU 1602 TaxID=2973933 RepID=UPI002163B1EE|nr:chromate efflux transporter [Mechercharimyces sp. CAU 1602]MCS1351075.1 chromate efflux transporter [Mechercharimyces sp. CAU 1602]
MIPWLDEKAYAELVALCQFLPGPASSQVGMAIGLIRAGIPGLIASWIGFTLPSVIVLTFFAFLLQHLSVTEMGWIHGLLVAAVVIVAQALWGMAKNLAPDPARATMAIFAAIVAVLWQTTLSQVIIIVIAALIGWRFLPRKAMSVSPTFQVSLSKKVALFSWVLFFAVLGLLPMIRYVYPAQWIAILDSFYRTGSLVFGGGHVVLPLLQTEVVSAGWATTDQFLAGYGAAQAVPGPLFTFSSYLGALASGWLGAILATVAIFLPSFFMIVGTLPIWEWVRKQSKFQSALHGVNAAVVGILLAALYDPVWIKAIQSGADFSLALLVFALLKIWKLPPWLVVVLAAIGGHFLSVLG